MKAINLLVGYLLFCATANAELITGSFKIDSDCSGLAGAKYQSVEGLALVGEYEDGRPARLCAYVSDQTTFTNGATVSALNDQGMYYVVGEEAEGVFDISEVARQGE